MSNGLLESSYNPDVLSCLANLSNDEVFTSPDIVNEMLDMLPKELFKNPDTTFLEPACKTGVFLREIAKRLIDGLEPQFPNLNDRLNHIFKKQLYGISVTELTSLLSRRSLYCSKWPNGEYSIIKFDTPEGNIKYRRIEHTWKNGNCIYCGASEKEYKRGSDLETYAYQFIHTNKPEEIFNMKFDVIIGNPPYQLSTGGTSAQATPLYNKFVEQAKKLKPRYLSMIIPSRWYTSGMGLNDFRDNMLNDKHIRILNDYLDASECFPGVEIKGGVCYFLWDRDNEGKCNVITHDKLNINEMVRDLKYKDCDVFIRYNKAISILEKIEKFMEPSFSTLVSPISPFGLPTSFKKYSVEKESETDLKIYALKKIGFIPENVMESKYGKLINSWKLFVPEAIGTGDSKTDWVKPFIGEPRSVSTATYLCIGCSDNKKEIENIYKYTQTKFFHFLLTLKKNTQHTPGKCYEFIPIQNFNEEWNDNKLFKKYNLSDSEISFIKSMVREEIGVGGEE